MRYRKIASKVARKIPGARGYMLRRELQHVISWKEDEITGLREAVKRLEDRNEEWAAEVRELRGENRRMQILWPVTEQDLIAADYRKGPQGKPPKRHAPPFMLNWVVPPVGSISGGHSVIFHIIQLLEAEGHVCRIYFYDPMHSSTLDQITENMKHHVPVKAELFYNEPQMLPCDALFATGWTTAYPVYNYKGAAKKFYLLQDYEAMFDPAGTYSALADNTYKMQLHGVSFSPYVAAKVRKDYGMQCDTLELATMPTEYYLTNTKRRKKVLFYARPVTPRRGFELGVLALKVFHDTHPEYEINFIGWDISPYDIPFPYVNHGILKPKELNKLYNECAAALALSFTSMSLLPIELLAAGCVPVVNDAPHTRMVGYAKALKYADPSPQAIADAIYEVVSTPDPAKQAKVASATTQDFEWEKYSGMLNDILIRELGTK